MTQHSQFTLVLILITSPVSAGIVEDSLHKANEFWEKSREYAGFTLERARRLWHEERTVDAQLWGDLIPRLDEILRLQDQRQELPESAWIGEDRASNAARINALLDEAAAILVGNKPFRSQVHELARAMAENRRMIAELKRRKMTAPSDSLWRKTVEDIEHEISERERIWAEQQQELERIRRLTAAELSSMGLEIDAARFELLFSTIVGDDLVDMTLAFGQVRRLTVQLESLTSESREDLPTARRYYGMYTILLKVMDHMHARLIDAIERDYLPRIGVIGNRARKLRRETRALQAGAPGTVLRTNLEAQQLTIDVAECYADYLKRQRRHVATSRERLSTDLAVAQNTFETVKMSGDLVALMQDSRRITDDLFNLQIPPLRPFENAEMKREFQRLTSTLRANSEA